MTGRPGRFGSLWLALAALLMIVSAPASASVDACAEDEVSCVALCGDSGDCDQDAVGGCGHCAPGHAGYSMPAPASRAEPVWNKRVRTAYDRANAGRLAAAPRDGPEHPPKA